MKLYPGIFVVLLTLGMAIAPEQTAAQPAEKGAFVYTIANPGGPNIIDAYRQDPTSGKLTFIAGYKTGGLGLPSASVIGTEQHPLITDGHLLYAVNPGSNDISVFRIHEDGTLELTNRPFPSGGIAPVSLALHDHLLYAANLGDNATPPNYSGFTVHDGLIEPLPASTITLNIGDAPSDILFNKRGTLLVGAREAANTVDVFKVGDDGRLSHTGEVGNQPGVIGLAFSPVSDQQLFGAITFLSGAAAYSVSPSGSISLINIVNDTQSLITCWEVIESTGTRGWFVDPGTGTIILYSIDQNGALARVSAHKTLGIAPSEVVLSRSGKFMYVIDVFSNAIESLALTGQESDGGLASIETVSAPDTTNSLIGLVFVDFNEE
jgi:6-phosphogluconolactonase (cycloisomerase 2 family)